MAVAPIITILKPGTFTDINGVKVTFTRADLEDVVASYDAQRNPAPLVIGHPTHDDPAYGWVERLAMNGDQIVATPTSIVPAFAEAVRGRRYLKVSASLFAPRSPGNPKPGHWMLKHVGFLGAMAPAIKGLGTVSFSEAENAAAITIDRDRRDVVSFVAPVGYGVDAVNLALHSRAKAIQEATPGMAFWDAFIAARAASTV